MDHEKLNKLELRCAYHQGCQLVPAILIRYTAVCIVSQAFSI
jgi:hypothetical protein